MSLKKRGRGRNCESDDFSVQLQLNDPDIGVDFLDSEIGKLIVSAEHARAENPIFQVDLQLRSTAREINGPDTIYGVGW